MRKALMAAAFAMLACSYEWDSLDPRLGDADLGGRGPTAGSNGTGGSEATGGAVLGGAGPGAGGTGQGGTGGTGQGGIGGTGQGGTGGTGQGGTGGIGQGGAGGTAQGGTVAASGGSSGWAGMAQAGTTGLAGAGGAAAGAAGLAGHAGSAGAGIGGIVGVGGVSATGGAAGAAGALAAGGSAGAAGAFASGGATGAGGVAGAAGAEATGGATGTGGTAGAAGAGATGGATGTGGTAGGAGGSCSDTLCGSECVDLGSNTDHCGECDRACSGSHVATLSCSGGVCDSSCSGAWLNCIQPAAPAADDGCETNGDTSTHNCGGCGVSCPRYQICNSGCTVPCSGLGFEVLFVVGDTALGGGDAAALDWLETQLEFTVTVVLDADSETSDADSVDLVVISSTCASGEVGTKFTDVAVPVATWEAMVYDDLNMTSGTGWGIPSDQTELDVVDPAHPLAAGLNGTLILYGTAEDVASAVPESSAAVVGTLAGDSSQALLFAYEAGADMYDSFTAPARRVGLPFRDLGPLYATEDGERLGLVAFCWAAGLYP